MLGGPLLCDLFSVRTRFHSLALTAHAFVSRYRPVHELGRHLAPASGAKRAAPALFAGPGNETQSA
jgi:hypothetical protein